MELYMETDKEARMRRICIYLTYDSQNIIDDYIGYFLQSMRPIADTIAVVCNMPHIGYILLRIMRTIFSTGKMQAWMPAALRMRYVHCLDGN